MSNRKDDGVGSWSFVQSSISLIRDSVDIIDEGLSERKWDDIAYSYGKILKQVDELNRNGLDEVDDYLLVPQSEDPLIPAKLGTVFSQEKEKLDVHLQNEFIEDDHSFLQRPNDNHRFVRQRIEELNTWSRELEQIFNEYIRKNGENKK